MIGDFRSRAQGEPPFWFEGGVVEQPVIEQPCESGMAIHNQHLSFSVLGGFDGRSRSFGFGSKADGANL
jgi:hypothetical protein